MGWLGAVQAQDYGGAKWALGQRSRQTTDEEVDRLLDQGAILRTHVMRPTWHFVLPEDIRWLLELTAPRLRDRLVGRFRQLDIDEGTIARAITVFAAALAGGHHLTRLELGRILTDQGISPEGQRLPHLLFAAEISGLIVSGPRRGRQFTYALLAERAPKTQRLDRIDALGQLARRYFCSHGPAKIEDFVWWSGLTTADARAGLTRAGAALDRQVLGGDDYWFDAETTPAREVAMVAHLLPNFDEYTVGYRDRSALTAADRPFDPSLFSFGSVLSNVVVINGRVRGAWRRTVDRGAVGAAVSWLDRPAPHELAAVEKAVRRYGRFLERPLEMIRV